MSMDEDKDGFAAEYVLGTLDAEERAQADALILVDAAFAASVGALGAPARRAQRAGRSGRAAGAALGSDQGRAWPGRSSRASCICPRCQQPAQPIRADAPSAEIIQMRQRMQRWRGFSTITGLMAACLVGIVLVREYKPDVLPPELRPQRPMQVVERIVEKPVEVVREVVREVPGPRPAQLVAVFQKDEQSPEFILTVDVEKRTLTVRTVAAQRQPDRDFQIWIQPRPDVPPESLGLVSTDEFTVRTTLAAYDPSVIGSATYGISLEPVGGSPTGRPTSPAIHAKLVQATPPQNP